MPGTVKTYNEYQIRLLYLERTREALRDGAGKDNRGIRPDVKKRLHILTDKISSYRRGAKRALHQEEALKRINRYIKRFFGVSMWQSKGGGRKTDLARACFYKMALENRIQKIRIAYFVGIKTAYVPVAIRLKFTKSFKTNAANYKAWNDFRNFVNLQKTNL